MNLEMVELIMEEWAQFAKVVLEIIVSLSRFFSCIIETELDYCAAHILI